MSTKAERYNSLLLTREFLRDLLNPKKCPKTKKELRERAYRCLRHYPYLDERGKPINF